VIKEKWGNKLTCNNCGSKFYDLNKSSVACPACETQYVAEKPRLRRGAVAEPSTPKPAESDPTQSEEEIIANELDDDVLETEDGDDHDEGLIEDTSEIGGDEDDIEEVIGAVETEETKE